MMPATAPYAQFIKDLPQAAIPIEGATGYIQGGPTTQTVFLELSAGTRIPPHSHGEQWGIVVAGELEFTMNGETVKRTAGDSYLVPNGAEHSTSMITDCLVIEVFDVPDRWKAKE
jgi:quercetin dioxygenase-like cupin family protein